MNFLVAMILQTYEQHLNERVPIRYAYKARLNLEFFELMHLFRLFKEEYQAVLCSVSVVESTAAATEGSKRLSQKVEEAFEAAS